jgi:transglutaminase-like putative cysteine protease
MRTPCAWRHSTMGPSAAEEFTFSVDPDVRVQERRDYFGTRVHEFTVTRPHKRLGITARARVEAIAPNPPPDGPWEAVASPAYRAQGVEFLIDAEPSPPEPSFAELREAVHAPTPLATLERLVEIVPERFEYRPGATYVGSTVHDLLTVGAGVCQDFAHLSLLLMRCWGLAARYVSGYLFVPGPDDHRSAEVATHAWVEVLIPNGNGSAWIGADPTNRKLATDDHVKVGHGRSYHDLPPIRGVYRGPAGADVDATVRMDLLDD